MADANNPSSGSEADGTHQNDYAMNQNLYKMHVSEPGRQKFQKIWVRTGQVGKTSSEIYDEAKDMPSLPTASIAPTQQELVAGEEGTLEVIMVGLVVAENYLQYTTLGDGVRNRVTSAERASRAVLERPEKVLRCVIPITEQPKKQLKLFVAVNNEDGLCELRLVRKEAVFYFEEYWKDIEVVGSTQNERTFLLKETCKAAASRSEEESTRTPSAEEVLNSLSEFGKKYDAEITLTHGGVTKHASMEDIMDYAADIVKAGGWK